MSFFTAPQHATAIRVIKQLKRQLPLRAGQQMLLVAICAATAREVLPFSTGLHLLLLHARWDKDYLALAENK